MIIKRKIMMVKKMILCSLVLFPVLLHAQSRAFKDLKYNLEGSRGVNTLRINGSLIKLATLIAEQADEEDKELRALSDMSRKVRSIDMINIIDHDAFRKSDKVSFINSLNTEGYSELMKLREDDQEITVFSADTDESNLENVVLIFEERRVSSIVSINGIIKIDELYVLVD